MMEQSERKKENNGYALLFMFLCVIISAFSSAFGLGEFGALVFFYGYVDGDLYRIAGVNVNDF